MGRRMRDMGVWEQLGTILVALNTGHLNDTDTSRVEVFLSKHWDQLFEDSGGGMQGFKVRGRTEEMEWQPPVLRFTIERHGGFVQGSSRAELQTWEFDTALHVARFGEGGYRQKRSMSPRLDVDGIAVEMAPLILGRREDPRLQWTRNGKVSVKTGEVLGGVEETYAGRQKRFRKAILKLIEPHGWLANGRYYEFVGPR